MKPFVRLTSAQTVFVCTSASRPARREMCYQKWKLMYNKWTKKHHFKRKCMKWVTAELSHLLIHGLVVFLCLFQELLQTSWRHVFSDENDLQTWKRATEEDEHRRSLYSSLHDWMNRMMMIIVPSLCSLSHPSSICGTSQCSSAPAGSDYQTLLWLFPVEEKKGSCSNIHVTLSFLHHTTFNKATAVTAVSAFVLSNSSNCGSMHLKLC